MYNTEGNALHFFFSFFFGLKRVQTPKKKRAKGKLVCCNAAAAAAATMRLSCERLCSHCCVLFVPFAPVIHTRTPFDFRECSAGASVCNAAVNSL